MAHDFTGTFNKAQFDRLSSFVGNQRSAVTDRIAHLTAEIARVGVLSFTYGAGGIPIAYKANPSTSYVARLMAAYEVLGGDAFYDLNIRSSGQAVFILKSDETAPAQMMSNGEVIGAAGRADADSADLVGKLRGWLPDVLDYRREYLERKIRRMVDYTDQLQTEILDLKRAAANSTADGSHDFLVSAVQDLIDDPNYRAISKDGDAFNKKGHAPFSSYEPGAQGADASTYQRGTGGPVVPGATESAESEDTGIA